ncbi:MAG: hypothetical protein IID51_13410 [Proteobacteria bacterium]|nr:hypothetical protein [Pseudomonadota bacterium]
MHRLRRAALGNDTFFFALDGNDSVTLLNVLLADLHADDFIFQTGRGREFQISQRDRGA